MPVAWLSPARVPYSTVAYLEAIGNELARASTVDELQRVLTDRYAARETILVDSGTSALSMSFEVVRASRAGGSGGAESVVIAAPAFVCPDVLTAAQAAGVRLQLYDLDPDTLSPEISSLRRAVSAGADAVVAVHFFGYPFAVSEVRTLCDAFGIPLIEDAAQAAGAMFDGRPAGAHGDLSVLSFGRGKGIGGGGGGALLISRSAPARLNPEVLSRPNPTRLGLLRATIGGSQLLFEQRGWFAIPSAIPGLHLGEAVYHEPQPITGISRYGAALVLTSLGTLVRDVAWRNSMASQATEILAARQVQVVTPTDQPGWLRLCALTEGSSANRLYRLGVRRPYQQLLTAYPDRQHTIINANALLPGSIRLLRELVTLPIHRGARDRDYRAIAAALSTCR